MSSPLVSIGIPTFNRASSLIKSVDAALQQTYQNIEIIISDNASTDDTQSICEKFVETNKNITYIRQQSNVGAVNNFNEVLRYSTGKYFMWLADDDWIDPIYVCECAKELIEHPEYSLVVGKTVCYVNQEFAWEETLDLMQSDGCDRLLSYYAQAGGVFYGLMQRNLISQIPMLNTMGCDWFMVASLAFLGNIKTIPHISIHRDIACHDFAKVARKLNWSSFQGNNPYLLIAISASKYIMTNTQIYGSLSLLQRIILSGKVLIYFLRERQFLIYRATILTFVQSLIPQSTYSQLRTFYRKFKGLSS
jgi:glycosyltransferase involved in cell wall biosynthesis